MNPSERRLFFTIDVDWIPGSHGGLEHLYGLIQEYRLCPTLFVTGRFAVEYPDLMQEAARRGYDLGTHGWAHGQDDDEDFKRGSYEDQKRWMLDSTAAVEQASGVRPRGFRAPNLSVSETTLRVLEECGYTYDSSVPAHRFDFFYGQVNSLRYFRSPLAPYHLSRTDLGKPGDSPVLEVPPSAYFLPMNMSSLRVLGVGTVRWAMRRIRKLSPVLVMYVHPQEFEVPEKQTIPTSNPKRYLEGLGPQNLGLVRQFLEYALELGYRPAYMSQERSAAVQPAGALAGGAA